MSQRAQVEYTLSGQSAADAMEILGAPVESGAPTTLTAATGGAVRRTILQSTESLATRARRWFLEAWNHPLWKEYIRESNEDEGYYIGGERQWSKDGSFGDLQVLKAKRRTVVSRNHIQPIVDVLTGFERQNQYDLKVVAQGQHDIDVEDADQLSWLMKFAQDQTNCQETQSDVFEDGVIRGMSAVEVAINWLNDPVDGEIELRQYKPGVDVIWDPWWKKYDLSDARYIIKFKWAFVADVVAEFKEHEEAIMRAVAILDVDMSYAMSDQASSQGNPSNPYGNVNNHPMEDIDAEVIMYDPLARRLLLLEVLYREHEVVYVAVNSETSVKREFETKSDAQDFVRADPDASPDGAARKESDGRWRIHERTRRVIKTGTVLPATLQLLDDGDDTPYENDLQNYPLVPYIAKRKGNAIYGVVRNLKDPQLIENKKMSQILDIIAKFANIRMTYGKNSIDDPRTLEAADSTAPIPLNNNTTQPPAFLVPPLGELLNALVSLAANNEQGMKTISGINTDLLGQKSDDTSGIAIARRQAQGQTIATIYFDNFKRTRRLIGQRLAKRVQQVITTEQVMRLTDRQTGETRVVMINPRDAKKYETDESYREWRNKQKDAGRPYVLRDLKSLKFDVTVSESPSTPSARQTALLALLEMAGRMPPLMPAIIDVALKLADVPDRQTLIERVNRIPEVAALQRDPQPPPEPPAPPPVVHIALKGELDAAASLAMASGQPPPAAVDPGSLPSIAGPAEKAAADVQVAATQAAADTAAAHIGANARVRPGIGGAGRPDHSGVERASGPLPLPSAVAANPGTPDNLNVALPQDAGFAAGGPPPKVPSKARRGGRL